MTTTFDTSGSVGIVTAAPQGGSYCQTVRWATLSPFTQGYIEALFADMARTENGRPALPWPSNGSGNLWGVAFSDLAPETLARIIADCEAASAERIALASLYRKTAEEGARFYADRQAGRVSSFPPLTVQLGDDGKVRFSERG